MHTEGGLKNPIIVHWSVSRQMKPRHLSVSSERVIFLDTIGSTVLHRLVKIVLGLLPSFL